MAYISDFVGGPYRSASGVGLDGRIRRENGFFCRLRRFIDDAVLGVGVDSGIVSLAVRGVFSIFWGVRSN